jgi:hypothetical protein
MDHQIGAAGEAKHGLSGDARPCARAQPVVAEGQGIGAERVADRQDVGPLPGLAMVAHDQGEFGSDLLGRPFDQEQRRLSTPRTGTPLAWRRPAMS